MFYKNANMKGLKAVSLCGLLLIGGFTAYRMQDDTVKQYRLAYKQGDVLNQFQLAEALFRTKPDKVELTYGQLDKAKAGFERLRQNHYLFADPHRLKDARQVLQFSPNAQIALKAQQLSQQQMQKQRDFKQAFAQIRKLETEFEAPFLPAGNQQATVETDAKLPDFVANLNEQYFLGALYQALEGQTLNNRQLNRLLNHQTEVLDVLMPLKIQLDELAKVVQLGQNMAQMHYCVTRIADFHRHTMQTMLTALVKDGIDTAKREYAALSRFADSNNLSQYHHDFAKNPLTPLAYQQWDWYSKAYLEPVQKIRAAILRHRTGHPNESALLSQTKPYSKLAYKYFWSGGDLSVYREQGPLRQQDADRIIEVLNDIPQQNFDTLDQAYAGLLTSP